jgi:hypothetical protein
MQACSAKLNCMPARPAALTKLHACQVWDALAAAHSLLLESGGGEDELCWCKRACFTGTKVQTLRHAAGAAAHPLLLESGGGDELCSSL